MKGFDGFKEDISTRDIFEIHPQPLSKTKTGSRPNKIMAETRSRTNYYDGVETNLKTSISVE